MKYKNSQFTSSLAANIDFRSHNKPEKNTPPPVIINQKIMVPLKSVIKYGGSKHLLANNDPPKNHYNEIRTLSYNQNLKQKYKPFFLETNKKNYEKGLILSTHSQQIIAQKMKFSVKDFFSKCNQVRRTTNLKAPATHFASENVAPWYSGYHFTQLYSTKPELRFAQVQILFAVCRRFAMVKISDYGPGWK